MRVLKYFKQMARNCFLCVLMKMKSVNCDIEEEKCVEMVAILYEVEEEMNVVCLQKIVQLPQIIYIYIFFNP